jgi:hypothetical protein
MAKLELRTHPEMFAELNTPVMYEEAGEHPSIARGVATLLVASLGAAWMSEILVGAAEQAGQSLGMSQMFMGVIVLALVGGAAESGSAIAMGRANRVDLSIGIAMGSCVQIALFVAPVLVLVAPAMGQAQFRLVFSQARCGCCSGRCSSGDGCDDRPVQLVQGCPIAGALLHHSGRPLPDPGRLAIGGGPCCDRFSSVAPSAWATSPSMRS